MGSRELAGAGRLRLVKHNDQAHADTAMQQNSPQKKATVSTRTKRLFTAEEAAVYLGYGTAWPVLTLKWNGELPFVQLSPRRIAFDVEDLDQFIAARKIREYIH